MRLHELRDRDFVLGGPIGWHPLPEVAPPVARPRRWLLAARWLPIVAYLAALLLWPLLAGHVRVEP